MKSIIEKITFFISIIIFLSNGVIIHAQSEWREDSFEDFRDGSFLDAGSNSYVSAKGRVQMITRWDFNNDGFLDILLPTGHGHTEKENLFIYLNNGVDIDGRSRIELTGGGSRDGKVADFNKDGYNDIVIANAADSHFNRVNSWIWYGSEEGFSVDNRVKLPAYRGNSIVLGDFNNDDWIDLAIACQWQAGTVVEPEGPTMSFIYWNSPQGFREDNRLPLIFDGRGANVFFVSDLDSDGIHDLAALAAGKLVLLYSSKGGIENPKNRIFVPIAGTAMSTGDVNGDKFIDIVVCSGNEVVLIPGHKNGYGLEKAVRLQVSSPRDVTIADVDQNGYDDIIVANHATSEGATWINSYVFLFNSEDLSNPRILELPTMGATGVAAADLNGDKYPEIVFSNQRVTNHLSISSYIYWNDAGHLYFGNHTQLPTRGPLGTSIGDINNDNLPDVLFFNEEGGFRDGPATTYVLWGDGTRDFTKERSTKFSTNHIFGQGHADLDDDGNVDLIFSHERFVHRIPHEQSGLSIRWGSSEGFTNSSRLTMITAYGGTRIADINKDGYLDILAGGACIDQYDPEIFGIPIFWGSASGYSTSNRSIIHHYKEKGLRGPLLMDLNNDGWLDIAGQAEDGKIKIWWGESGGFSDDRFQEIDLGRPDHLMYLKGADFNRDGWLDLLLPKRRPHGKVNTSFIYFGSKIGFLNKNRIEIEADMPYQNSIADFDKNGWLDILMTSYGTDLSGNRPSVIHWGNKNGFFEKPHTELNTYGASGSESVDYDGDGWIDLFVANHRKAGSIIESNPHLHTTSSMLYWGSPNGYSDDNRWEVEGIGPSGLNLRDAGNSHDRGLYEDYISSSYKLKKHEKPVSISWEAETPLGTSVKFQIRSSDSESKLTTANWIGPDGNNTWFTSKDSKIRNVNKRWIQYRARLTTPNGGPTPYLTSVVIAFE
jgi:hypothetical protein